MEEITVQLPQMDKMEDMTLQLYPHVKVEWSEREDNYISCRWVLDLYHSLSILPTTAVFPVKCSNIAGNSRYRRKSALVTWQCSCPCRVYRNY